MSGWILPALFAFDEDGEAAEEAVLVTGGVTIDPTLEAVVVVVVLFVAGAAGFPRQCTTHPSSNLKDSTTLPSSCDGMILPLKMMRSEEVGIVVSLEAN